MKRLLDIHKKLHRSKCAAHVARRVIGEFKWIEGFSHPRAPWNSWRGSDGKKDKRQFKLYLAHLNATGKRLGIDR